MIPDSGIAVFDVEPIGRLRLDDGGLRLITPFDPDPMLYPTLEQVVAAAFAFVDSTHTSTEEAMRHMHEAFGLPKSAIKLISLTGVKYHKRVSEVS